VEVVDRELRIGQRRADRGGVAGLRIDHHRGDPVAELAAARRQPDFTPAGYAQQVRAAIAAATVNSS
jgi:hypothetical protein